MSGQRFGLSASVIGKIHGVLAQHPLVRKAVIYGSRAKGNYKPGSDIDLSLFAAEGQEISHRELASILDEIDDLLLPYTMDLSAFEQLNHDKLREHIERVGQVFYECGGVGVHQGATLKQAWQTTTLGDVCDVIGGGTPSKDNPSYYSGEIAWATVRDMRQEVITETEYRITPEAVKSSATNIISSGNVVIATRVGLGKVCLVAQDTAINQDLRGIIPRDTNSLSVRFLFWWLKSIADLIVAEGTGATVQGVKLPFVKSLPLRLPPLPEQHRIVAILDEAFDGIAFAKANAEKNLRNARALFESNLQSVFSQRGVGWMERRLGDLVTFRNGINFTKSSRGDSVKIVGVKDFQSSFWAPLDKLDTVTTDGVLPDSDMLQENDILFVRSNGNMALIGRSLLVGAMEDKITHSGFTIRARLTGSGLQPKYLCHFLKSNNARQEMIDRGIGTNIKSLNQAMLSSLVIPFPSSAKQVYLVERLESLNAEIQGLESLYQQKLAALDSLKKSLLYQAFSGHL